jgi:subtilisin family serine protease
MGSTRRTVACAVTVMLGATLAVVSGGLPTASAEPDGSRAPVVGERRANAIPGRYLVVMEPRAGHPAAARAERVAAARGAVVTHRYRAALDGFAAKLSPTALEALRSDPDVAYIEADQRITVQGTQSGAPWGLDRVDQRNLPLSGTYRYDRTGAPVTAYVIDTGIRAGHTQFGGRVAAGFTSIKDGRGSRDCNGHGTHVAGTIGGKKFGIAKQVRLRPVRVLNCAGSGSTAKVVAGIDWVTAHHGSAPAVANMSLGGDGSAAMDAAVANSISDGITYVVAAGNFGMDACDFSPARVGPAVTVGATTRSDGRAGFSNYGSCLDVFAPGKGIVSAWHTTNKATRTLDGTSMASPHVAGAAVLYLQQFPTASPEQVADAVVGGATTGKVTGRGSGSPDRLLYSLLSAPPVAPPTSGGNLLGNPGFESGDRVWVATPQVITTGGGSGAHTGSWMAWLGGWGEAHKDVLNQTVTIPAAGSVTLRYQLDVTTDEDAGAAYDKLAVQVVAGGVVTTVRSYSNLDESNAYVQRTVDLSAYAGRKVTLRFSAVEDGSVATSFRIDDVSLTTG